MPSFVLLNQNTTLVNYVPKCHMSSGLYGPIFNHSTPSKTDLNTHAIIRVNTVQEIRGKKF